MERLTRTFFVVAVATAASCAPAIVANRGTSPPELLTAARRTDALQRADVWAPTAVASMNLRAGPQGKGAFPPFATVNCDYVDEKTSGSSAKFVCAVTPDDHVKVKYGKDNVEVYAEVAATRLLWALGFGSDRWYPVTVVCHGCPADPAQSTTPRMDSVTFDVAAIERKMPGKTLETKPDEGWAWKELDAVNAVDAVKSGDQAMHRDALRLLAVFLQHTDSKPVQQRLICLPAAEGTERPALCAQPFMLIHDVGLTFGRSNLLNLNQASGANFDRWAAIPIWKEPKGCVGKLSGSLTGTMTDPTIGETGRKFLANLLMQLSDAQLRDLFAIARFDQRPAGASIDAWVDLFKKRRQEIVDVTCPS
jgi:hypothetical protein